MSFLPMSIARQNEQAENHFPPRAACSRREQADRGVMDEQHMMELGTLFNMAQHNRLLRLHVVGDDAGLHGLLLPYRLCYEAALSTPYSAALTCLSPVPDLALKQMLGRAVQIQIDHSAGTRVINGHVDSVRQLGTDGGITS